MKLPDDQKTLQRFGAHLASLRIAKGFSLRTLGDEAELSFSEIHLIEKGERNPSLLVLLSLAQALRIRPSELITF